LHGVNLEEGWGVWSVANAPAPNPLMLAGMAVNADMDTREVNPSVIDTRERRVLHLPWPRALPVSSLLVGLRKPPLHDSRCWSPGHRVGQGAAAKGRG